MAQTLSPAQREDFLAAGFDASEIDSWTLCECGSGEPTMFVLQDSPVCSDCWAIDSDLWDE